VKLIICFIYNQRFYAHQKRNNNKQPIMTSFRLLISLSFILNAFIFPFASTFPIEKSDKNLFSSSEQYDQQSNYLFENSENLKEISNAHRRVGVRPIEHRLKRQSLPIKLCGKQLKDTLHFICNGTYNKKRSIEGEKIFRII
jgi:hypothetical protein